MLSANAVAALAPHLTIDGFAFDVELLYLARRAGFGIRAVGITCHCRQDSRVRVRAGIASIAGRDAREDAHARRRDRRA